MAKTLRCDDRPHVPQKDFYTVKDVATLLLTSEGKVRSLARRRNDPLPFRCFENSKRGMFISRPELAGRVKRNTILVMFRFSDGKDHDSVTARITTMMPDATAPCVQNKSDDVPRRFPHTARSRQHE